MDNNNTVGFEIKKIKEFLFVVNEGLFEANREVEVKFQHVTSYYPDTDFLDLTLRVFYSYDPKEKPETVLVDFHVQNIFKIINLNQFHIENVGFILPKSLMSSIVGIAISHTRSLMAMHVAGTVYQENIIPIVNPTAVTEAFYPNLYKNENIEIVHDKPVLKNGKNKKGK